MRNPNAPRQFPDENANPFVDDGLEEKRLKRWERLESKRYRQNEEKVDPYELQAWKACKLWATFGEGTEEQGLEMYLSYLRA